MKALSIWKSIWTAWNTVAGLVRWNTDGSRLVFGDTPYLELEVAGYYLYCRDVVFPCRLSNKGIFFWEDLWDSVACSWKDWLTMVHDYALLPSDWPSITELVGLIPLEDVYNIHVAMPGTFWRYWGWSFGRPLQQQYDSKRIYSILHQRHALAPVLNAGFILIRRTGGKVGFIVFALFGFTISCGLK